MVCIRIGKMTFTDGGVYEGEYRKDMRDESGRYIMPDGGKYEGNFSQDNFAGNGRLVDVKHQFVYYGPYKDAKITNSENALYLLLLGENIKIEVFRLVDNAMSITLTEIITTKENLNTALVSVNDKETATKFTVIDKQNIPYEAELSETPYIKQLQQDIAYLEDQLQRNASAQSNK
jgi:hypothetical protein